MTPQRPSAFAKLCAAAVVGALPLLVPAAAHGTLTGLAVKPLQSLNRVKPNIMFTLDDSGSMNWEFLPDFTASGIQPQPPAFARTYYCRDRRNCGGVELYPDSVNGNQLPPQTEILYADPPLRSSAYNKLYYDPSVNYNLGKTADGGDLSCESGSLLCTGPWTRVYSNGFAGYPSVNSSTQVNLTKEFPDTVWCNKLASPPSDSDKATAFTDGSKCRLNGRAYPAASDGVANLWTVPKVAAGYNYPNAVDIATGADTKCGAVNEYCVFDAPAKVLTNPYYYAASSVQYCQNQDAAGFGLPPCGNRWDEASNRYVRFGSISGKGFDPLAFTRIDIVPATASYPSGRSYAQELANFAKWYAFYRTRMLAMKTAGGIAFSALTDEESRVGFHTINSHNNNFMNVKPFDAPQKSAWFGKFYSVVPGGGTPLPQAVYRIGEYYSNSDQSGLPDAADPAEAATGRCQANFHLLSTDGYWNRALTGADVGDQDRTVPALPGAVPGFTPGNAFPRPYYEGSATSSNTLADLAMYYWIRDIRPDYADNVKDTVAPWQHVTLYGLSIGAEGSIVYPTGLDAIVAGTQEWPKPSGANTAAGRPDSIDDLWHAALNSRGKYFNAANPQQLAESIVSALADFTSQSGTGAAVGIAGAQLSATRKYGYRTSYESGWWGDVRKYELDTRTGELPLSKDGNPKNDPLWSAATAIDAQVLGTGWDTNRRIVTINDATGAAVPFRLGSLSAAQQASLNAGWSSVTPAPTAQAVLDYLRGDKSNEGVGTTNFRARSRALGDIVYSAAVPVGAPSQPYDEAGNPGYPAFVESRKNRTPMVYVGANDGMLHALVDSTVTADAGKEAWAYVPKVLFTTGDPNDASRAPAPRFQLGALSFRRGGIPQFSSKFYVNTTPRIWDIDFANTNTSTPPKSGNDWRTVLIGGLGAGGRAVYALDVTTPVALTDTEADIVAAKRVLWEFSDDNLGYVYDAPTLVKTRRYGWVVLVASGYNNPGGKGILYVLNPTDGRILRKLSTDVGTDGDPSGLASIRAFTPSRKDPYVLQAYGGDLKGNVWRFDLSDPDETKWKVELVAKLADKSGKAQPITTGLRIEIDQNNNVDRYVFVGTGMLLSDDDLTGKNAVSNVTNTLYVIRDGTRTAAEPKPAVPYSRSDLNSVDGASVAGFTGPAKGRGWYQDASDTKQKITTDVIADVQTVVYTFSKPADDPCEAALSSTLYARELISGSSVLQPSQGGDVVANVADVGAIAGLALVQGQPGSASAASGDIRVQVTTMKGQVFSFGIKLAGTSTLKHRVSWRLLSKD